jgi:hypothetical protein
VVEATFCLLFRWNWSASGRRNTRALEYRIILAMVKQKNPHAVALGRGGGRKSGKARMEKLTPQQRQEIAQKAIQARWAMAKKQKSGRAEAGFLNAMRRAPEFRRVSTLRLRFWLAIRLTSGRCEERAGREWCAMDGTRTPRDIERRASYRRGISSQHGKMPGCPRTNVVPQ